MPFPCWTLGSSCHFIYRVLYEELKLRDRMFQEFREQKEREIAGLMAIKGDLEVRLQRVSEEGEQVNGSSHIIG